MVLDIADLTTSKKNAEVLDDPGVRLPRIAGLSATTNKH